MPASRSRFDHHVLTPTTNAGIEAVAIWKTEDFSFVANY
jgi:hypothetical protein